MFRIAGHDVQVAAKQYCSRYVAEYRGLPETCYSLWRQCRAKPVESQPVAAGQPDAPEAQGMHEHRPEGDLVAAQGVGGDGLDGIEELVQADVDHQRSGQFAHGRVGSIGSQNGIAGQPHGDADQGGQARGEEDAGLRRVAGADAIARANSLADQHQSGDGQRQRQHVDQCRQIADDAVTSHHGGSQLGHQQGDEGEGGDLHEAGETHRNPEAQEFANGPGARGLPMGKQVVRRIGRVAQHVHERARQGQPADDRA